MNAPPTVYLPGAGGLASFWHPVVAVRGAASAAIIVEYPGFGATPHDPTIASLLDLRDRVVSRLPASFDLVAQSMGGLLAMLIAIEHPKRVRRLVLVATSGGIDVERHGAREWRRDDWIAEHPEMPRWFIDDRTDLTDRLGLVTAPTLLLFGDADPIAPPAVGTFLSERIRGSRLSVIAGGTHDVAQEQAALVASLIEEWCSTLRIHVRSRRPFSS